MMLISPTGLTDTLAHPTGTVIALVVIWTCAGLLAALNWLQWRDLRATLAELRALRAARR